MTPGDSDDEEHDGAEADNVEAEHGNEAEDGQGAELSGDSNSIYQPRIRAPRAPEYGERVLAHFGESKTARADVAHVFDFVVYFAQNCYKGLPYENWPNMLERDEESGDEEIEDEGDEQGVADVESAVGETEEGDEVAGGQTNEAS
ncbi:hypothetical protein DOTSEDRAFT_28304 [Dothistroma septosporum NZE10]|uniref:Uncharacterized protein n=1 Tax=Dothistroma septosporum (strain NZE10 / CBS 128990) TaxID=675120 RepID=M2WJH3_DOTSN|nr:hypothetical protein DOTSEDRAFT_28304 [Dothistroma septosporum NZE10]